MKKVLLLVIMLIITIHSLSAQKKKDILYLKNGSIIYGKLLEVNNNQYKIKTSDGSIFIFSSTEVDKFENETPAFDGRKKSGLGFALEGGFLVGPQNSDYKNPFSFNVLGNITAKTRNIFSIGSGVEYLGVPFTPLFMEYKYLFSDKKTTPFIFFRGGRLLHLHEEDKNDYYTYPQYNTDKTYSGGGTFTIGTGISWSNEDGETYLSFAYRNAHTSYSQNNYNNVPATYKSSYNRLEIKFGFKF
jgi:hypothetical protein